MNQLPVAGDSGSLAALEAQFGSTHKRVAAIMQASVAKVEQLKLGELLADGDFHAIITDGKGKGIEN